MSDPRVLSIQSHVVSGYVGNKSAVFPMQLLGFEVDFINSVQFSNHTGHKSFKGQILTEKELNDLTSSLKDNEIDNYSHLLTGYIGSAGFLKEIYNYYAYLKHKNPDLIYVCDPVMGDNGKLYVSDDLIPLYRDYIVPIATILTPNLFEAQLLTEININTYEDVWRAIDCLHKKGCQTVCISSAELANSKDKLSIFASTNKGQPIKLQMEINKINAHFTGTGDLFSSLFLCFMHLTNSDLKNSLEKTVAALQGVLKRTFNSIQGKEINSKTMELKLIQSQQDILNPNIIYRATVIN